MLNQEMEVNALKDRIIELDALLNERSIYIQEAGSIAEASLIINKVMETAQQAADQYLDNIKALSEKQRSVNHEIESEAKAKAADLIREAQSRCDEREQHEKEYIDALWASFQKKADDLLAGNPDLKETFAVNGISSISAEQLRGNKVE